MNVLLRIFIRKSISVDQFAVHSKIGTSERTLLRYFIRNIPASFKISAMSHGSTKSKEDTGNGQKHNESNSSPDDGKRMAAFKCVDEQVKSGYYIGVGTGTTAKYAIKRLGDKVRSGELKDIVCVPTSFQARQLILENHLPLGDLEQYPELDVAIDGADEVDEELNCIKGGGGCLTQEKIVMSCSKYFYIIADASKMSKHFGDRWTTVPLEVIPLAYAPIKRRIEQLEGGDAQLRMASRKAGPVVTDNGNFILDWTFPKTVASGRPRTTNEWQELNIRLKMIPGIVETGLFLKNAQAAYFGQAGGGVTEKKAAGDRRISALNTKRARSPDSPLRSTVTNGTAKP